MSGESDADDVTRGLGSRLGPDSEVSSEAFCEYGSSAILRDWDLLFSLCVVLPVFSLSGSFGGMGFSGCVGAAIGALSVLSSAGSDVG